MNELVALAATVQAFVFHAIGECVSSAASPFSTGASRATLMTSISRSSPDSRRGAVRRCAARGVCSANPGGAGVCASPQSRSASVGRGRGNRRLARRFCVRNRSSGTRRRGGVRKRQDAAHLHSRRPDRFQSVRESTRRLVRPRRNPRAAGWQLDWDYVWEQLVPLCELKEEPEIVERLRELKADGGLPSRRPGK